MKTERDAGDEQAVAGLVVSDGTGQYFAIAWAELQRHRVPAACVAALAAVVHGAEPPSHVDELQGYADARALFAEHALLSDAINPAGRFRLAVQWLEAWALLR